MRPWAILCPSSGWSSCPGSQSWEWTCAEIILLFSLKKIFQKSDKNYNFSNSNWKYSQKKHDILLFNSGTYKYFSTSFFRNTLSLSLRSEKPGEHCEGRDREIFCTPLIQVFKCWKANVTWISNAWMALKGGLPPGGRSSSFAGSMFFTHR